MRLQKVVVLLSTYNGSKYLQEQMESILNQKDVVVEVIVRDDGSTDSTIEILKKYAELPNVTLIEGNNLGVVGSFLWLIDNAPESEYYALADQDDIWYSYKLSNAVISLSKYNNEAVLYGANQNFVSAEGIFTGVHFKDDMNEKTKVLNIVYRNYIAGCTMVFNKRMLEIFLSEKFSRDIAYMRMHDTWMMLVARIRGRFIYDDKPVMDFRRHSENVSDGGIDIKEYGIKLYFKKLKNFLVSKNKSHHISETANVLLGSFSNDLDAEIKERLLLLANYRKKLTVKCRLLTERSKMNLTTDNDFIFVIKAIFNRF